MAKKGQRSISEIRNSTSGIALVTDSASDIAADIAREYKISVIPIYIHYNSKEFRDGIDIKPDDIYRLQMEEKVVFWVCGPN